MVSPDNGRRIFDHIQRLETRTPDTCVILALQSAFPAPLTKEERALRHTVSTELHRPIHPAKGKLVTPEQYRALRAANMILESRAMTAFFRRLQTHATPMGRIMSRYDLSVESLGDQELSEIVVPGNVHLLAEFMLKIGSDWHMMHAKKMANGIVVSGNDGNRKIVIKEGAGYMLYRFRRREDES